MKAFWEFLIKDPLRKLIALSLTIVLYAVLYEGKQQQKDLKLVPLEISCDEDVFLAGVHRHAAVHLTVRGSESRIKNLTVQDIVGTIKISRNTPGFESGTVSIQLTPENFICPRGIEIVSIEPEVLTLPVQRRRSEEIRIVPEITGRPRAGYVQGEISCYPETVLVTGPEQAVLNLREVRTEIYNIKNYETETVIRHLNLLNMNPDEFSFNISSVKVTIPFTTDITRTLPQVPIRCFVPANLGVAVYPERQSATVTVSGSQSETDTVSAADIMLYVDLSDPKFAEAGEHTVPLRAVLNDPNSHLRITVIEPSAIKIRCEQKD
jgi:YbbR domain-containing protein